MDLLPLVFLTPLLLAVGWSDLRHMRIPNALSLIAVAVFAITALILPMPDLVARVGVAGAALAIGFVAFSFGLVGGGDVKILAALLLFVPVSTLPVFANVFSASLILGIVFILGLRRIPAAASLGWKSVSGGREFPMGISIALAGLLHAPAVVLLGVPLTA